LPAVIWRDRAIHRVRVHFAALAAALIALAAVPALASATAFTVNSTGDEAKAASGAVCETSTTGECTLRAAIEAVDADTASAADTVDFDDTFIGQAPASTIALGSELPAITHAVEINGGRCPGYEVGLEGPCVEITLPSFSTKTGLTVKADDTTIDNLSIVEVTGGIDVEEASGFAAAGNWLGIGLDGEGGPHMGIGIFLGPGAESATIGGDDAEARNAIGFGGIGINVAGSSGATISGNYIGVKPDGDTVAGLDHGITIVDTDIVMTPKATEDTLVGGTLTQGEATSPACDGPCNVIVASTAGIDLHGEALLFTNPATGPTTISGNYIGLSADGTRQSVGAEYDIYAAPNPGGEVGPTDVTIGGPVAPGGAFAPHQNVIDGGETAIHAEDADGFLVEANAIGRLPGDPSATAGPEDVAVSLSSQGLTEAPRVVENELTLDHGPTVFESLFEGAEILHNTVTGGVMDVHTEEGVGGNLIEGNQFANPDRDGILIENNGNTVVGNTILGADWHGVSIDNAAHNRIGGDSRSEENRIEHSGLGAIEIAGEPTTHDEVAGNYGAENGAPFIQLRPHGPIAKPNDEIEPPVLTEVFESGAAGTARAGTKIRIFTMASTDPSGLEPMIATATADSAGHWEVEYAAEPEGTLIAATQTQTPGAEGATSEVSAPKPAAKDPEEESGEGGGGGTGGTGSSNPAPAPPPIPAPAPTKPKVKTVTGPKKGSASTTAKFKFSATSAGATFECKLDAGKWAKCKSPKAYKKLKPGKHTFQVRAAASGLKGPATKFQFTVKP
jgi:CSLREA domain-containing protein